MKTKIDDGGPAFPQMLHSATQGMTLRDWFAGMAMQALLTHPPEKQVGPKEYTKAAYGISDAMLAARKEDV